jgi:hypothetical protein
MLLKDLPAELIEAIAACVATSDLCNIRLACRALHQKTSTLFGRAYFDIVETNLSKDSLSRLTLLSSHSTLRLAVRRLRIVQREFGAYEGRFLGFGNDWHRVAAATSNEKDSESFEEEEDNSNCFSICRRPIRRPISAAQDEILVPVSYSDATPLLDTSSPVVRRFQSIVRRFENCTAFEICDTEVRNGPVWSLTPSDAIHLALATMASGYRPVRELRLDLRAWLAYSDSNRLPPPDQIARLGPLLFLQKIELSWHITDQFAERIVAMITSAGRLRTLAMNFGPAEIVTRIFSLLAIAPALPAIENLRIERVCKTVTPITRLLVRLRESLKVLRLRNMYFSSREELDEHLAALVANDFPCLEMFIFDSWYCILPSRPNSGESGLVGLYFCPLRYRTDALRSISNTIGFSCVRKGRRRFGAEFKFRARTLHFNGRPEEAALLLKVLANEGYYLVNADGRPSSPNLPDVREAKGDLVGRLVTREDYMRPWKHLTCAVIVPTR